ncbi:MAG: acetyl-CoA carboxylase biotin carboxylase subunit [Azospirillum sp.]|nr:acetyl-CoA carboxylase biotin carboxylase subunit [Azospirillum sp.]
MFSKLLIANRGEIACRVIRTARRLGIRTVAVYSEADRDALHVELADEAYPIGPAPARDSYLKGVAILDVAERSGAEAIHPGYGFLSENAQFAQACARAGVVFVGPPPHAIRAMGSKGDAKAMMAEAGVPLIPGYHGFDQHPEVLRQAARTIGFPILIKPFAGGGGKGMRVVEAPEAFPDQLAAARREAMSAFGDDRVLLEKYLARPRHVEVQVFADRHGACVALFERDCSIQRRHQKVVEEAPAPGLDAATRRRMGEVAVAAARKIDYRGAGTVEFLLDPSGAFYFIEMNTRLQVEHAVTEMVTGQDLVEWQLRVAAGEPLPLGQDDLALHGHAIEVRLYAEDPANDFLPQAGRLGHLGFPATDCHVRVDTGVRSGDTVSIHYDPMIAKLIVWDHDRAAAVRRLRAALAETRVVGLATNRDFLAAIANHPGYLAGDLDTRFIERHHGDLRPQQGLAADRVLVLASLAVLLDRAARARAEAALSADPWSPWARGDGWRLNDEAHDLLTFRDGAVERQIRLTYRRGSYLLNLLDGAPGGEVVARGELLEDGSLEADLGGVRLTAVVIRAGAELTVFHQGGSHRLVLQEPLAAATQDLPGGRLTAPMPGRIIAILVEPGTKVDKGQPLLVMEAMKMEHTLKAPAPGTVVSFHHGVGDQVEDGVELVEFAVDGEAPLLGAIGESH